MSKPRSVDSCPDCSDRAGFTRREFLKTTAAGVATLSVAGASIITVGSPKIAPAAEAAAMPAAPETLVATLFKSLNDKQKEEICFPFDHELRSKVDNNWHIVTHSVDEVLNPDQRQLVREIFLDLHSEEYAGRVLHQVDDDNKEGGGFGSCAIALFGEPGAQTIAGKTNFEFVFTGRHVTRRCDGNSVAGAAFGGPIFYGHAAETDNESAFHRGNIYWYQALRANEVFQSLDGRLRKLALRQDPRPEKKNETVKLSGSAKDLGGVPLSELSHDQKDLVRKVMADLLAPFRKPDADKALAMIEAGGFDNLHLSFFNNQGMDIGDDGVWDVWQLEGPSMVWYFRGAPHVHTWVNIRDPKSA